ncbi:2,3-bisphosphoglycerate-dependent phosphoglycerate mutase [Sphingobacterium sp. lm-10]|uniref:2,3-bisphosphoglycerate-dependent phosphoglycerate mutase n=1 Tax=Sphingobacterium sp. lm-10 TaxID=2944904 RepID=UPI002021AF0A|nr:2,3-bisphosphoglycerate-dependent phosphoglycerate mutase [Sphingobacterium sp. lm-10]MCL7986636.1 2,3-bisphosphoglycerate-dependent phosphoglycerate mutase [Sphingobacterium sp. lm-10]
MKLILVRHGQSQWNLHNRFTGWKDVDLTHTGREEARIAASQIRDDHIDVAFTSKLIRAQHTLQIIQKTNGWEEIPVIMDQSLNERSYGDLEGLNKSEAAKKFGDEQIHIWRRSYDVAPPGGESLKDTYIRVVPYFRSFILPQLINNKNILIVAHGNSLRALVMFIEQLSPAEILEREIATCVPIIYDLTGEQLLIFPIKTPD